VLKKLEKKRKEKRETTYTCCANLSPLDQDKRNKTMPNAFEDQDVFKTKCIISSTFESLK